MVSNKTFDPLLMPGTDNPQEGKATKAAGAGALFPKGYAPLPGQKLPWVCPVRNCRKLFSAAWALGGHFNVRHGRPPVFGGYVMLITCYS